MNRIKWNKVIFALVLTAGLLCTVPGLKTEAKSKSKVSYTYTTTTKKYRAPNGTVILKATYKGVKFKGSSAAIKKMNRYIAKDRTQFFKEAKSRVSTAKSQYDWWKSAQTTYTKFTPSEMRIYSKVTYNKKGVVSIREGYDDYFFGAAHGFYYTYGQTFKISSGKKLTLNQVIKGSDSSDKKKLVAAFGKMQKKYPNRFWDDAIDTVKKTKMKKANFYLGSQNAVVCYAPYALGSFGAGETYIKIPHGYR